MTRDGVDLDWIVAVDWGKDLKKRRAWVADVLRREVRPLDDGSRSLAGVLDAAQKLPDLVLVGIDAAIGVPRPYFDDAMRAVPAWKLAADFPAWIVQAVATPGFLDEVRAADAWTPGQPFIAVPKGAGSLSAFWVKAGGRLLRRVDQQTGAKSAFVVSGIPGTVGSGSRALWKELAPLLTQARDFTLWPFEGPLTTVAGRPRIVLGEIYPRVCYALALDASLPAPLRRIAKTKRASRVQSLDAMVAASWFRDAGINLMEPEAAMSNEDEFDAMISAAGLLRCVLGGHPLERPCGNALDAIEGDILGAAALNLSLPMVGDLSKNTTPMS